MNRLCAKIIFNDYYFKNGYFHNILLCKKGNPKSEVLELYILSRHNYVCFVFITSDCLLLDQYKFRRNTIMLNSNIRYQLYSGTNNSQIYAEKDQCHRRVTVMYNS